VVVLAGVNNFEDLPRSRLQLGQSKATEPPDEV